MKEENVDYNEMHKYIFNFYPKISSGLDHYACIGYYKGKVSVYGWGSNASNQLGLGINLRYANNPSVIKFFENFIVCSVCCTNYSTFVLVKQNITDNGCSIYSFGKGNNGLLGYKKKRNLLNDMKFMKNDKEKEKEKLLDKINNKINKEVLNAFNINKSFSSLKSVDSLIDFDIDNISSVKSNKTNNEINTNERNNKDNIEEINKIKNEHFKHNENNLNNDIPNNNENILKQHMNNGDLEVNAVDEDFSIMNKEDKDESKHLYTEYEEKEDWFTPFPIKIKFPEYTKIKFISCGDMHTLSISTDGILYGWGFNNYGCVGNGNNMNVYEPTPIYLVDELKYKNNMDHYENFNKYKFNVNETKEKNKKNFVIHCSAGSKHSLACNLNGEIYSWGYGGNGRLGLGNIKSYNKPQLITKLKNKTIIYVCSGNSHSGCIDIDHNVYTWGNGKFYKLGHGDDNDILNPRKVEFFNHNKKIFMLSFGCFNSLALSIKGDVFMCGTFNISKDYSYYICKIPKQINTNFKCISVHASTYVAFGVTIVGDLITFGNYYDHNNTYIQEKKLDSDSDVNLMDYLIGDTENKNNNDEKSYNINSKKENFPIKYIKELRGKVFINDFLNDFYKLDKLSYYINKTKNGNIFPNCDYMIMNSKLIFEKNDLVINSRVKYIDGSDYFSVFLLESGKIYVSGYNKGGELGNGEFNLNKKFSIPIFIDISINKITKIACGNNYVLALSEVGNVYGWGKNDKSQLGIGVIKDCYEPIHIKSLSNVINIYAGYDHSSCIVNNNFSQNQEMELEHGELYVWGNAESGKVGLGLDYTQGSILLPRKVNLLSQVYKCSLGTNHSLFLTDNNDLYACGSANNGRLGLKNNFNSIVSYPKKISLDENIFIKDILAGSTFSMILSIDGFIYIWGEFIKNTISYDKPTLYPQISNVKKIIGKYRHVLFLTYDNKLFGLGDNYYFQIVHDSRKIKHIDFPKLIPYFMKSNINKVFSFKNASFVQLENNEIYAWGYSQNCHLGIGLTQLTYIKYPQKIVKSWLTYDEKEIEDDQYNDASNDEHMYNNYCKNINEINLIKKKFNKKEKFTNEFIYTPYYEEQIEKFIYEMQVIPNVINWEFIQMLLKKEEYSNSLDYIKSFEDDLTDLYSKHIEFILNLNSYERQYNDLYLNYQNFILSNISNMNEPLPVIMHTKATHIFDANMSKLQELVYILQQQPMYLIILCLIHNHKNIKNLKKLSYQQKLVRQNEGFMGKLNVQNAMENSSTKCIGDKENEANYILNKSSLINHSYEYDRRTEFKNSNLDIVKQKHSFYKKSTLIICSFIFDLYYDLKNERVRNIFTIFLIKLGIEEMKSCLHVDSLFKVESSIFFLLIKMLFMKNEFLINFSHCISNLNNSNSFVVLLNEMSRKRLKKELCMNNPNMFSYPSKNCQEDIIKMSNQNHLINTYNNANISMNHIINSNSNYNMNNSTNNLINNNAEINMNELNETTSNEKTFFFNDFNEEKDKEFTQFIKGKGKEENISVHINPYKNPVETYNNLQFQQKESPKIQDEMKIRNTKNTSDKDVFLELDFVKVFKELCKIFKNIKFPDMFKIIMKYLFKHFVIYEKNMSKENSTQNKIYFFNNEDIIYVPFFNLLLMAILNPLLKNIDKMREKFFYPPIPSHIISICNRICDFIEVLYLNKYESLNSYKLKKNFISVKYIYEHTFNSFIYIINNICNIDEDIYVNTYINLFRYHLNNSTYYVQLRIFQLCHIFNLFFRYQNYLLLSFNDPIIEIINFFYTYKHKDTSCMENVSESLFNKKDTRVDVTNMKEDIKKKNKDNNLNKNKKKKSFLSKYIRKDEKKDNAINNEEVKTKSDVGKEEDNTIYAYSNKRKEKNIKKLIFNEEEIQFFITCKLIYNIKLDIRFLLKEKNMSICEFTRIPMPQYICYRKRPYIKNNEYLFSVIHKYHYEKDKIYIISECLKNCPLFEHCIDTNNLILKLKSLDAHYLSLKDQKEINLVHLIRKTIDILLSDEMIFVDFCENFPPNLYIHKFKDEKLHKSKFEQSYLYILQNNYDRSSFFHMKWRNIVMQIALNILKKKKHMNYLKKLHEEQEKIEDLILNYQFKMKNDIETLKNAIIFVSKLLIEKPILIHGSYFEKDLFFNILKNKKDLKKEHKIPYESSTVHIYEIKKLIKTSVFNYVNELLNPVIDYLTVEIFFDLNNIIKLSLVVTKNKSRNVINEHTFTSQDIYNIYNSSPFILYFFFKYNKTYLCSISGFNFMHLLHNLVIDIY
ncbi:guanidine nucleotide exchange factor, putative [Plasmodium gallinaceum]|uniref:Guanidine nucleotide exchange factor, putative n=1 Tax=Plasmodium gallinaceum TaxID=5849 RepID=A0A1J1H304_PLAGA|nr:guanidine nucleotide exchange factor, putative [Plasmodium gallinaceum]CRG97861.1 guanidine nucleotide exchange factor, putative [Plasmodium gallinaceum]